MLTRRAFLKRSPIKRHPAKREGENPSYREWLAEWPCYVCLVKWCRDNDVQIVDMPSWAREAMAAIPTGPHRPVCSRTEVAHVGVRGFGQRCPDREAMPLGRWHHEHATAGGGPESAHTLGKAFWEFHGINREEALALLRRLYKAETWKEA